MAAVRKAKVVVPNDMRKPSNEHSAIFVANVGEALLPYSILSHASLQERPSHKSKAFPVAGVCFPEQDSSFCRAAAASYPIKEINLSMHAEFCKFSMLSHQKGDRADLAVCAGEGAKPLGVHYSPGAESSRSGTHSPC